MNKGQIKKSILNLVGYYVNNVVQTNINAQKIAESEEKNEGILKMMEQQIAALNYGLEQGISDIVDGLPIEEVPFEVTEEE